MLEELLAPFDWPRQAAYNFAGGLGKLASGQADSRTLRSMMPGASGALLAALLGPGAGIATAGAAQGLGMMTDEDTFKAATPADLARSLGGDPESWWQTTGAHLATDPLMALGAVGVGKSMRLPKGWKKPSNLPVENMSVKDIEDYLTQAYGQYSELEKALPVNAVDLATAGPRPFRGIEKPDVAPLVERLQGGRDIAEKEYAALLHNDYVNPGNLTPERANALLGMSHDVGLANELTHSAKNGKHGWTKPGPFLSSRNRTILEPYGKTEQIGQSGGLAVYDSPAQLPMQLQFLPDGTIDPAISEIFSRNLAESSNPAQKLRWLGSTKPGDVRPIIEEMMAKGFPIEEQRLIDVWRGRYLAERQQELSELRRGLHVSDATEYSALRDLPKAEAEQFLKSYQIYPNDAKRALRETLMQELIEPYGLDNPSKRQLLSRYLDSLSGQEGLLTQVQRRALRTGRIPGVAEPDNKLTMEMIEQMLQGKIPVSFGGKQRTLPLQESGWWKQFDNRAVEELL